MIPLRDYQKPIVDAAVLATEGMIVMSTGSGKTIVALAIIERLGLTATFLVNRTNLLEQAADECKKFLGIEPAVIGGGKKEIGDITIATIQTLQRDEVLLKRLAARTAVLIVDECHSAVTAKNMAVVEEFAATHVYGLTATPVRDDGTSDCIGFYFGPEICNFELASIAPTIHVIQSGADIPISSDYNDMIVDMVEHEERNDLIKQLAFSEAISGRRVLVLTKRIEHAEKIHELLPSKENFYLISSKDKNRNELLQQFKKGELPYSIIVGTMSLLATGMDIPSLDTLIFASDLKGQVITVQSAGRIMRLFDGKRDPIIYDIVDEKNGILLNQFEHRKKVYDMKNWDVVGRIPYKKRHY